MTVSDHFPQDAGLTLVEMLVVLAIVGVMAGAVALSIGSGSGRGAEVEARRLATRIALAADEAMVTGRTIGFVRDRDRYRFVTWQAGRWQDDHTPALEPHALPAALTLEGEGEGGGNVPVVVGADAGGSPMTLRIAPAQGAAWTILFDGVTARAQAGG